jgi:hypothetical protein
MTRRENDVESTFVLSHQKCTIFESLGILVNPPKEVDLTKNPGDLWVKIFTTISIMNCSIFKILLKNLIVHFVAPSHFILHPKAVKLKGWLFKDEPWPLRGFLHGFSFQV